VALCAAGNDAVGKRSINLLRALINSAHFFYFMRHMQKIVCNFSCKTKTLLAPFRVLTHAVLVAKRWVTVAYETPPHFYAFHVKI